MDRKMFSVVIQCLLCYLVLVHGEGSLDIIRERLHRLETRFTEDIALLRKEFYHGLDNAVSENTGNGVNTVSKIAPNVDVGVMESKFETLKLDILGKLETLQDGLASEKRVRRNIQSDIESLRTVDTLNANTLKTGFETITHILEVIPTLRKLQIAVDDIAKNVKTDISSGESRVSDCSEWYRKGHTTSGVYTVYPESMWRPLNVYCDMETDNGGWTVFQRRMDGSENFYRNWMDYTFGFGNLSREFWLGNEFVHRLTSNAPHKLCIDLEDFENESRVANYGLFSVGPRSGGFVLVAEFFTGTVNDSLIRNHNNKQFSTYDHGPSPRCPKSYKGGWWYGDCHSVNINGLYLKGKHDSYADGVNWYDWKGHHYSLKKTEMKFRPW